MSEERALDFKATTKLLGALTTKPVSYAKDVQGNREALEKAKFRTDGANATWVSKKEREQAETDVRFLTKTEWHIGNGYNIGVGYTQQHGWDALGSNLGQAPPRTYEHAGLTVKSYTKSSGPFMEDTRKDGRVSGLLGSQAQRHTECVNETEVRITRINASLEPVVVELIQTARSNLKGNEEAIELLFLRLADEFLTKIDMAQLQGVWSEYQEQSKLREIWIAEFEEQTEQLEVQRAALVQNELKSLGLVLLDIAHQNRGEIGRFLEGVAQKQNIVVINNRRAYADMMSRLRRVEIERDKKARIRWEERKNAWYLTLHDRAVAKCRATLESKQFAAPKKRDTLYGALRSQQVILFERRLNMWLDLQALTPPSLTQEKAKGWVAGLEELDQEQELEHKQRCGAIRKFEIQHYESSVAVVEALKEELRGYAEMTDAPMPTDEELEEASTQFNEMIVDRKVKGLAAVAQCSETLHLQLGYLKGPGHELGRLIQIVADTVAEQEKRVGDIREGHRSEMERHVEENRVKEVKLEDELEFLLTQMRQDASTENLKLRLPETLVQLDKIKGEYRNFYEGSMDQTRTFERGMNELLGSIQDKILIRMDLSREDEPMSFESTEGEEKETPVEEKKPEGEDGEEDEEEDSGPVVYDDEEVTVGEEYDFVTLKEGRQLFVRDRRIPAHASDMVGVLAIPKKTDEELEAEEEAKRIAEEEAATMAEAAEQEANEKDSKGEGKGEEEEGEEGGEAKEKEVPFVADAMTSPLNPFSAWGNEPLLEVLEIPLYSLVTVRRMQRRQLLEYKEDEDSHITKATDETVKRQQEALTIQLDERLRQWAPRAGRAEMDVYEVRDTQLQQHLSRTHRHLGAVSLRAAAQQQHFSSLRAEAQRQLSMHIKAQKQRVTSLAMASNSSQLTNYQRLATHESSHYIHSLKFTNEAIKEFAQEALHVLQRMNKQFLESCYVFEQLGGPKGKDGTYNPEEVEEYRQRLADLDNDAAARLEAWVKYADEMVAAHTATSQQELAHFQDEIKNVETDICLLEAVDKEVRSCSLQQQEEQNRNDAAIEALDSKLLELESLCAGVTQSTLGTIKSGPKGAVGEEEEEEESQFQGKPASVQVFRCLASIRWRVFQRATYMQCLQTDLSIEDPIPLAPPFPPPEPEEEGEPDEEPGEGEEDGTKGEGSVTMSVTSSLKRLHIVLWPPKPEGGEDAEGGGEKGEGEGEEGEGEVLKIARFPMLGPEETPQKLNHNFTEAIDKIQERQREALEEKVASYFEALGEREITRKKGDPACTPERFIPLTAEEFNEKNAQRLSELQEHAMQTLKSKVRYFRSLVARLSTAMSKVPTATFANVNERAKRQGKFARRKLEDAYAERKEEWMKEREAHNVSLKPSLGNSNARKELDEVCDAETARYRSALEQTTEVLNEALALEARASCNFAQETTHATAALLALFDSIVQPADLVPTEEDVIARRKTLVTLMREFDKSQSGSQQEPPPEGKAFHRKTWKGMRVGEVGAKGVYEMVRRLEKDATVTGKQLLAEQSEELGEDLEGNDTANHNAIVRIRDRAYSQYRAYFVSQTEKLMREYKAIMREEQRWRSNWNTLVGSLKDA